MRPAYVRVNAGIPLRVMGEALGVCFSTVNHWELGRQRPKGRLLTSYVRVIEGLARHLEIPEEAAEPQLTGRAMAAPSVSDPPWREAALWVPGSPPRNP